jgi:hypothetical protein
MYAKRLMPTANAGFQQLVPAALPTVPIPFEINELIFTLIQIKK